ncbi:hypothetical protein ACFQZI_11285 [Mucilaginibacter lutimaris]|uniref:Glycosyltransferase n=1 Tax=Mucilaginibacter lutimaris TaxID=931629 RepID=A0ABW2ZGX0_9SPHI
MLNIFKHAHFLPDAFGHGGNKRTAQIDYLLSAAGIEVKQAELTNTIASGCKLSFYLSGLLHSTNLRTDNKTKYAIGRYKAIFDRFVQQYRPDIFIWESTIDYHLLLADVLYKHHIPVIALPHNLESLVAGNKSVFSAKSSPQWMSEELDHLKLCKKVYTISREEHWLLSNHGMNVAYLPYYPAPPAEKFLLEIRQKRSGKKNEPRKAERKILLLGTFHNRPTITGYNELLRHIQTIKGIHIDIAGFGSEMLNDKWPAKNIRVWGSVDNDTLARLIVNADSAVVHQQPSSGALTRIPELLIAGLPVIANIHAARSCDVSTGIMIYDGHDELRTVLSSGNFTTPAVLNRPTEEHAFSNYIKTLIKEF